MVRAYYMVIHCHNLNHKIQKYFMNTLVKLTFLNRLLFITKIYRYEEKQQQRLTSDQNRKRITSFLSDILKYNLHIGFVFNLPFLF